MFEFQEILPYFLSLCMLCSVAYVFVARLYAGAPGYYQRQASEPVRLQRPLLSTAHSVPIHLHLARIIKRKESPDDDSTDCTSPLVSINKPYGEDKHADESRIHLL
ncbi:MAG: hypothetical protein K6T85_17395 [Gorillibacterium sp.]|nr:hypothetical protein [Gorillibacterium sp.]